MTRTRLGTIHKILFLVASVAVLFASFEANLWRTAEDSWFQTHQVSMQAFIVGRMVLSRQAGIFAEGGLTGLTGPDAAAPDIENPNYRFQYQTYLDGRSTASFAPYKSQIGGQGMLFSALDAALPLGASEKLLLFNALTSLMTAAVLAAVFFWFFREFSALHGWTVLIATALSQWMTVFGRNLWWSLWAFFLPMVLVLYHLDRRRKTGRSGQLALAGVVFAGVFLKCVFNGYEYITTALVMTVVPLVYYAVADRTGWRRLLADLAIAAGASLAAILLSMFLLCLQVSAVDGSLQAGVDHIVTSFLRRSYADPAGFPADYSASLNAGVVGVLVTYLKGIYLDLNRYLPAPAEFLRRYLYPIRYAYLIVLFAAATAVLGLLTWRRPRTGEKAREAALTAATWFSLLAPISWFVIFKAHSFIHTHMNFIVWQMPFTIFGFALCASAIHAVLARIRPPQSASSATQPPA
jgi:hypothetical protein